MAPTLHQQIPEGDAFVEPRDVETVRGLLAAAEALGLDPAVVRTQSGGYLAPAEVVDLFLENSAETAAVVTTTQEPVDEFGFLTEPDAGTGEVPAGDGDGNSEQPGGEAGEQSDPDGAGEQTDGDELVEPKKTAAKPEWVAYAVAKSAQTDEPLTEEQATALTTAQLIERFGASE